jgi:sugar diacid utilization regulator
VKSDQALPTLDATTRRVCDQVADGLELAAEDLAATMTEAVFREIPAYRALGQSEEAAIVLAHSLDHVHAVARAIRAWQLPADSELAFVRSRGALRAGQQVPLIALLHSYRLGHRTVWERLVQLLPALDNVLDALLALTTLTLSYTELISGALAEGFLERERTLLVERDRDRRDLLENILLGRLDSRADTLRLASNFALVAGAEFLVVVMMCLDEPGPPPAETLTRSAEVLRRYCALGIAQPFVVVRQSEIVSIAPLARARPAAIAHLVQQAHAEITGLGGRWAAGLSTVCGGLAEVARGYEEARHALGIASAQARVCPLLEMRVTDYLFEHATPTAMRMIPPRARRVLESAAPADKLLVETLRAYAEADTSVRLAAERLAVHPNTVSYRLQKLSGLLGRDPSRFSDLVEVLSWARLVERSRLTS